MSTIGCTSSIAWMGEKVRVSEWVCVCVSVRVCVREREGAKLRVWNLLVFTSESNGWKQISGHRCNTSIQIAKMRCWITIYLHMSLMQTRQLISYVYQVIWAGTRGTRLNRIPKSRSPARTQPAQLQTATLIPSLHLSPCFLDGAPSPLRSQSPFPFLRKWIRQI